MACWRPLCPFRHSGASRAAKWAAVWTLLARQEGQEESLEVIKVIPEPIVKQTVDVPVPQIIAPVSFEQTVDVPVPQTLEEVVKAVKSVPQERIPAKICEQIAGAPVEQPGDQARRVPADSVHRQGYCRYSCGVAATGPSDSDYGKDCGSPDDQPSDQARRVPADSVLRHERRRACGEAATGPSNSDSGKDCGSPDSTVHRQSYECARDHADHAGDQVSQDSADSTHRQSCRRACGETATGPSSSDSEYDCGSPDSTVLRQSYGSNFWQFQEETVEVIQPLPPEHFSERAQIVDAPVPQSARASLEAERDRLRELVECMTKLGKI